MWPALVAIGILAALVASGAVVSFYLLKPSDWAALIGALIGAAATVSAVLFTAAQTRNLFLAERRDERQKDRENRLSEIHRALSVGAFTLVEDIGELHGIECLLRDAVEKDDEEARLFHYRRALTKIPNASAVRLEAVIQAIGDVEAQVCRVIISYRSRAEQLATTWQELADIEVSALRDGWVASLVEIDLKFIRMQRSVAKTAIFLIEDYLARSGLPPVPRWHNTELDDEQKAAVDREEQPTDRKTMLAPVTNK